MKTSSHGATKESATFALIMFSSSKPSYIPIKIYILPYLDTLYTNLFFSIICFRIWTHIVILYYNTEYHRFLILLIPLFSSKRVEVEGQVGRHVYTRTKDLIHNCEGTEVELPKLWCSDDKTSLGQREEITPILYGTQICLPK